MPVFFNQLYPKTNFMKKTFLQILFLFALAFRANSQTVSLAVITPPCDSNGVVVATFTGLIPPIAVYWNTHSGTITRTISILTDTLRGFTGGDVNVRGVVGSLSAYRDTVVPLPFIVHTSATNSLCPALASVSGTVIGGTPPYTYRWIDIVSSLVVGTTNPLSVPTGYYTLVVTDASGCVFETEDSARNPVVMPAFSYSVTRTPALCPSPGSATVTTSGGTLPFTYNWLNTSGTSVSTSNPATLAAGTYSIIVTDATGCAEPFYYPIRIINTPDFTASLSSTLANCTNGTITATVTGGVPPYSYWWSTGATSPGITGLSRGYYKVLITDAIGCTNDTLTADSVRQAITIGANTVPTPATCIDTNGSIIVFGSGGTTPYTYLWSNGATTQSVGHLGRGIMDVTVTDARGCIGSGYGYVNTSSPVYATYTATASLCTSPTGTATLSITGGTLPYTVRWYTIPMQSGMTATALAPGNYYFDITDAAGCTRSGTVVVPPIDIIALAMGSTPATCLLSDGTATVAASAGVPPYTYLWTTGSTTTTATGLAVGAYHVTVTDANGCTARASTSVSRSTPLILGLSTTSASCIFNTNGAIHATASLGVPPYTYTAGGTTSTTGIFTGLGSGDYWVYVTDAAGCTASAHTHVDYNHYDSSCLCLIKGNVYHDINDNCTKDVGEPGIYHIQMHCSGIGYNYTDPSGDYYFLVPSGTYSVSQNVLAYYPLSYCQPASVSYTAVAGTGCRTTINFADSLNPIRDIHVSNWDFTRARPGFAYTNVSVITNDGTSNESNILASYKPDGQIYAPSFVPSGIFLGTPYYYNTSAYFPTLLPGAGQYFLNNYFVPASIPLGTMVNFRDTVAYQAPVSNWLLDYSPWNNTNDFNTEIVGSYDPNFKEVSPKGTGATGIISTTDSILEYMVHFQNVGNYAAENVVVVDTLSANLDWRTMKPVFNSNRAIVTINEAGVAKFTFNNINLPPASSQPIESNAFFTYTVKQMPGLAIGSRIKNTAYIYFDFNAPIITNTTINTIGSDPLSVPNLATADINTFNVYPNPATNSCIISLNNAHTGIAEMKVADIAGRTMIANTLSLEQGKQNIPLNVASLTPGVYFVTINGNGLQQTQKLVIMK